MKDFTDILNSGISDELLAAYIDGNTTESENALIESNLNDDSMLAEAYKIANDCVSIGSSKEWENYNDDYESLNLELPPVIDALNMVFQNQDYGLSFNNDNNLFDSETYPLSNGVYDDSDKMGFDDTLISSDMEDVNW